MTLNEKVEKTKMEIYTDDSQASLNLIDELREQGYSVRHIFSGTDKPAVICDGYLVSGWCRIRYYAHHLFRK